MPQLQVLLLFRKARLRHEEQAAPVPREEARLAENAVEELLKFKVRYHRSASNCPAGEAPLLLRISRLIAAFRWFSSPLPIP